jgi:hypothetical protein
LYTSISVHLYSFCRQRYRKSGLCQWKYFHVIKWRNMHLSPNWNSLIRKRCRANQKHTTRNPHIRQQWSKNIAKIYYFCKHREEGRNCHSHINYKTSSLLLDFYVDGMHKLTIYCWLLINLMKSQDMIITYTYKIYT